MYICVLEQVPKELLQILEHSVTLAPEDKQLHEERSVDCHTFKNRPTARLDSNYFILCLLFALFGIEPSDIDIISSVIDMRIIGEMRSILSKLRVS